MKSNLGFRHLIKISSLIASGVILGTSAESQAINIKFDYTYDYNSTTQQYNFFSPGSEARARLEDAAAYFELFTDSLSAINPGGVNTWTPTFRNPSTGVGSFSGTPNLTIPQDTLIIYVAGTSNTGIPGIAVSGRFTNAYGSPDFANALKARGQLNALAVPPTDYGPWGGSIGFAQQPTAQDQNGNTVNLDWNFNLANPTDNYQVDFLTVALHEIAGVLGFGTSPSWQSYVSGGKFTGPNAKENNNGADVPVVGLHWQQGTTSTVSFLGETNFTQEANRVPAVNTGTRHLFTTLDYAGMRDVGWQLPNPSPTTLIVTSNQTISGTQTNTGPVIIGNATLQVDGNYIQDTGATILHGGTLKADNITVNGGKISGSGTIDAQPVFRLNNGTLSPGSDSSVGRIDINGTLVVQGNSQLSFQIGGRPNSELFDFLSVNGPTLFANSSDNPKQFLDVSFLEGFDYKTLTPNDEFTILESSVISGKVTKNVDGRTDQFALGVNDELGNPLFGQFTAFWDTPQARVPAGIILPSLQSPGSYRLVLTNFKVESKSTPEPMSTMGLLTTGVFGIYSFLKRGRKSKVMSQKGKKMLEV